MSPIISVIIPIYNAALYLEKCVNSVLRQTLSDLEVLLIDDGSTDESSLICQYFVKVDCRCHYYSNSNKGVSSSRNLGIDKSKGEYVIFLDADDFWCVDNALEVLYGIAVDSSSDIVRGQYQLVDVNDSIISYSKSRYNDLLINVDEYYFHKYIIRGEFFIWLSLIKKTAIGDLRFNECRSYLEDMEFYCMLANNRLVYSFVPLFFYAYRKNPTNASSRFCNKRLIDTFSICYFFDSLSRKTTCRRMCRFFRYYSIMMYVSALELIADDLYFSQKEEIVSICSLTTLRSNVLTWSIQSVFLNVNSWVLLFSPAMSISVIRLRNRTKTCVKKILQRVLSILWP